LRGLVPRIHVFVAGVKGVDGRVKPGQDEGGRGDPPLFAGAKLYPDSPANRRLKIALSMPPESATGNGTDPSR
jgi:hypothetical protein